MMTSFRTDVTLLRVVATRFVTMELAHVYQNSMVTPILAAGPNVF